MTSAETGGPAPGAAIPAAAAAGGRGRHAGHGRRQRHRLACTPADGRCRRLRTSGCGISSASGHVAAEDRSGSLTAGTRSAGCPRAGGRRRSRPREDRCCARSRSPRPADRRGARRRAAASSAPRTKSPVLVDRPSAASRGRVAACRDRRTTSSTMGAKPGSPGRFGQRRPDSAQDQDAGSACGMPARGLERLAATPI